MLTQIKLKYVACPRRQFHLSSYAFLQRHMKNNAWFGEFCRLFQDHFNVYACFPRIVDILMQLLIHKDICDILAASLSCNLIHVTVHISIYIVVSSRTPKSSLVMQTSCTSLVHAPTISRKWFDWKLLKYIWDGCQPKNRGKTHPKMDGL